MTDWRVRGAECVAYVPFLGDGHVERIRGTLVEESFVGGWSIECERYGTRVRFEAIAVGRTDEEAAKEYAMAALAGELW